MSAPLPRYVDLGDVRLSEWTRDVVEWMREQPRVEYRTVRRLVAGEVRLSSPRGKPLEVWCHRALTSDGGAQAVCGHVSWAWLGGQIACSAFQGLTAGTEYDVELRIVYPGGAR